MRLLLLVAAFTNFSSLHVKASETQYSVLTKRANSIEGIEG